MSGIWGAGFGRGPTSAASRPAYAPRAAGAGAKVLHMLAGPFQGPSASQAHRARPVSPERMKLTYVDKTP